MKLLAIVLGIAAAVGFGYGRWTQHQLDATRVALRDTTVAIANVRAAADSSVRTIQQAADQTVAVATRLAYQGRVDLKDSLATLGVAHAALIIEADSLRIMRAGAPAVLDTVAQLVRAADTLEARDSLGVTASAVVEISLAPSRPPPRWRWHVVRHEVAYQLDLSCRGTQAAAAFTGPAFAPVVIDSVIQDDEICVPTPAAAGWRPIRVDVPDLFDLVLLAAAYALGKSGVP